MAPASSYAALLACRGGGCQAASVVIGKKDAQKMRIEIEYCGM